MDNNLQSVSIGRKKFAVFTIAAVLVVAVVSVIIYSKPGYLFKNTRTVFAPTGTLYLSLSESGVLGSAVYNYDIQDHKLEKTIVSGESSNLTPSISSQGIAYVSNDAGAGKYLAIPQIFLRTSASTTELSRTVSLGKLYPRYSTPLDTYVYEAIDGTKTATTNDLDNRAVYLLTDSYHGKYITQGATPSLTPDGESVVVLRKTGLYLTSLTATSTALKIWGATGEMHRQDGFSISPDGSMIAWTVPDEGKIYLMHVSSWAPFSGSLSSIIDTTALMPVFSPDSAYLAYIRIDLASSTPSNPRLVIRNLQSGEAREVQSLSSFDARRSAMTFWRE